MNADAPEELPAQNIIELIRDEMIRRLQLAAVLLGMMAIGFIGAWLLVSAAFQ